MARTNVDIDEQACLEAMHRYGLKAKRDAIKFALRAMAVKQLGLDEARNLRASGWEGDLEEMRADRATKF